MPAGLITRDAAGNVLLDTTTAMFRLLGVLPLPVAWYSGGTYHDMTGSATLAGLTLGTPFFFFRPPSFANRDFFNSTYITFNISGENVSWSWVNFIGSSPSTMDIAYGVRS